MIVAYIASYVVTFFVPVARAAWLANGKSMQRID